MSGYATLLWPVIIGICLYASLIHLQIGLRRPIDRIHVLFGLLALSVAVGVFGNVQLATAHTVSDYQAAAWLSSIVVALVFVILPWFVTYYADEPKHGFAAALSCVYLVILGGNFFQPHSMLLSAAPVLEQVTLPWGERITRSSTPPTTWNMTMSVAYGLTIAYLAFAMIGLFRRGPRVRAWGLLLSAGPFAASLLVNILVRFGIVNFPYVAAPGFLAMVAVMSVVLTRESRRIQVQMQALLNNVPAVAYLKQIDGRYVFVNRRFEQLYCVTAANTLGKTDAQLFDAERAHQETQIDRELLSRDTAIETEEAIIVDGRSRTVAKLRFTLHDDGGAYAICGIATDITERKAAADAMRDLAVTLERRVARRTNELSHLNRELEAFAYSVSHDLRAPLTAVNGFAELLLREHGAKLDQNANRYLNRIRDASLRMAGLIQDLLGLSRVTQQSIERVPTDLAPMINATLRTLREADATRVVSVVAPASLPANGDPKLLALALNNLLANAWKYTSKTADARIEIGTLMQDGETVYFIKDNGAGFNSEHADRLFRPFVRLHADSDFPGTGIGLATVSRIVAKHGGRIWADGQPNAGATFYFTLPENDDEILTHTATFVESPHTSNIKNFP